MVKRGITGTIFVIILIGCILLNRATYLSLFSIIVAGLLLEYYSNVSKADHKPQSVIGTITGTLLFLLSSLHATHYTDSRIFIFLIPFFVAIYISELFQKSTKPFDNIAHTILGIAYIAVPFSTLNYMVFSSDALYHPQILLGFFIILWSYDTGAYLVGKSIGKHRLLERVSPKKSWEGAIGGIIIASAIGALLSHYFTQLNMIQWVVLAIIICIFATFGDLSESMLKRSLNIKDSGTILPGHGGLLDRFDSVLLAAPVVFLYLQLIK